MSDYTLTEQNIKYFVSEVQRWCRYFQVGTWQVQVSEDGGEDEMGSCWADINACRAIIYITREWNEEPTNKAISRVAFHEVCELLLIELSTLAESRFVSREHLEVARHRIIKTLENSVWKRKRE